MSDQETKKGNTGKNVIIGDPKPNLSRTVSREARPPKAPFPKETSPKSDDSKK